MDLLRGPLEVEAPAFRYSAAVAGLIWAWFAVLAAAALGLWRIRVALPPPKPLSPLDPTGARAEAGSAPPPAPSCNADAIATPKARFTAYFDADDGSDEGELGDGVSDCDEEETEEEALWGWEPRMVRKQGDPTWYR